MKEFRDKEAIRGLLRKIKSLQADASEPIRIMEVCGTHTMTIHRYGLKPLLEEAGILMLSGPGCPVCITPDGYHEAAIDLVSRNSHILLATFGDMTRVPTQKGSLQMAVPAPESLVKIVYSPDEALALAEKQIRHKVVFFGVGFETTIPGIAASVKAAFEAGLDNFFLLGALWIIPPPLKAIVESEETAIRGFLYPGHVSAIIGTEPYRFIAEKHKIPGAVAGFEPTDILIAIISILEQIRDGTPRVDNAYSRVVRPEGNPKARAVMEEMLIPKDSEWRGLGCIPASGLTLKDKYRKFDAECQLNLNISGSSQDLNGCRCGDVLRGKISPPECPLFGQGCSPESPHGPCMVSFEGACLAYYRYSR